MLPVLLAIGPFKIYSFSVCLFIGLLVGLFVIWRRAKEEYYDEAKTFDVVITTGLWALLGARVAYILLHWSRFWGDTWSWSNVFGKPGFEVVGAYILGAIILWRESRKLKWDFFELADMLVVGFSLLGVFFWLGSFLNGTGMGRPTGFGWGVEFAGLYDKRHPAQLYALLGYGLLFGFLGWAESKYRTFEWYRGGRSGAKSGFLAASFLIGSGLIDVLLSLLVAEQTVIFGISLLLIWGSVLVILGIIGLYLRSGREVREDWQVIRGEFQRSFLKIFRR